jgi:hypothetical protein
MDLVAAAAAIDQSSTNIEDVFTGVLGDTSVIVDLLGQIRKDFYKLDLMEQHFNNLSAAFEILKASQIFI